MRLEVAGPFKITRHGTKKNITKKSAILLKKHMEEWRAGLSESCGCYVFAKRAGRGITPWYVGQACRRAMLKEILNSDNVSKYNDVLDDDKGTPIVFVIAATTPAGKFRKRPKSGGLPMLTFLERWLIATAIEKNRKLKNNKETMFLRNLHVVGFFNAEQGESTAPSQELSKALW